MIGSSLSKLRKENSCSVKLQGGPPDHNPGEIPVEDGWIIILRNNSKWLLSNDKQMPHEIMFTLLDEIQNTKKMNTRGLKEKGIWKRSKTNSVSCFDIYQTFFQALFYSR